MAFSHGTADAQKSMGVITMALVSYGVISRPSMCRPGSRSPAPLAMALGTAAGGWRIIKTVGQDFVKLQPVHGFCVETASAGVILGASAIRHADQHHPCHHLFDPRRRPLETDVGGQLGDCLCASLGLGPDHPGFGGGGVCDVYGAEPVPGQVNSTVRDVGSSACMRHLAPMSQRIETKKATLRGCLFYSPMSSPTSSISLVSSARASSFRRNLTIR